MKLIFSWVKEFTGAKACKTQILRNGQIKLKIFQGDNQTENFEMKYPWTEISLSECQNCSKLYDHMSHIFVSVFCTVEVVNLNHCIIKRNNGNK